MNLIEAVERERHHVVVDMYTPTWNELIAQYKAQDVEVNPAYQRGFRWGYDQQTAYIESLLLNIPTPPVFLAEKSDGKFEVIDGLQRFSTIVKFFAAEILGDKSEIESNAPADVNNIAIPSVLAEAQILGGLLGISRATLPDTLVRTLRYSRVQVILLKKESSSIARYNVFTRLNRAGTTLSNQEIRNCSARLFDSQFANKLNDLGNDGVVRTALALSPKEANSMGAQESVLRLIAFANFNPPTKSIEDFLDDVMYQASSGKFNFSELMEKKVKETFEIIAAACPNGEAFKFLRAARFQGAFSSNLFDIVACGVFKNLSKCKRKTKNEIKQRILEMHTEEQVSELTGAGSNTRSKMMGRVTFGKSWFSF